MPYNAPVHVLVAEDDRGICALLAVLLADYGCIVETASDGLEALSHLKKTHYDLVVTDLVMPNLDGLGLLAEMATRKLAVNSLNYVTTGGSCDEIRDRVSDFRLGHVDGYLEKPFTAEAVKEMVERARQARHKLLRSA